MLRAPMFPMLACPAPGNAPPDTHEWIQEEKLDGWRLIAVVRDGRVEVYGGRNSNRYDGQLPYLESELARVLPAGTVLDGELIGHEWGQVQGVMTSKGAHRPNSYTPALTLVAFDLLSVQGTDVRALRLADRRGLLDAGQLDDRCDHVRVSKIHEAGPNTYTDLVARGAEGTVSKRWHSTYRAGKSPDWLKAKAEHTIDATIIGTEPGKPGTRFAGMVGAFTVRLEDGTVTTVKCQDDRMHDQATATPEQFVGRVIELKHNGRHPRTKVPRHPRIYRLRDDRSPTVA